MSTQTQVLEKLVELINLVNATNTNAKKIDELPLQEIIDPASRIHVSIDGVSKRIDVSQLITAVSNGNYNQLLNIGEITVVGNVITIPAGAVWTINNVNYTTTSDTVITVPLAATDLNRTDILVANTLGQIILEQGIETAGIAVRPNIPASTVLVTEINVTDASIGDPTPPIVGAQYVEKIEFLDKVINDSGSITIGLDGKSTAFILTGGVTEVIGFEMSDDFLTSDFYIGKEIRVENQSGGSFTFKHNGTSGLPALFPLEQDFVVNDKDILILKPQKHTILGAKLISVNRTFFEIDAINGLQDALDAKADMTYVDGLVVGLWDDRGSYNASSNTFPSSGGSGTSGAINKGDIWTISTPGTLGSESVENGDTVRALVDSPGTTTSNWAIQQNNIGYVPENSANKATTMTGNTTSNIVFLTAKAIYDWAVGKFQDILVSGTNIKTINGISVLGSGNLVTTSKQKYFHHIKVDGNIATANGWHSFANTSNLNNYDQNSWISAPYGTGSTITLSTLFTTSLGRPIPDNTKLIKAMISFQYGASTGTTDHKFEIHTNENVDLAVKGALVNNQAIVTEAWTSAGGASYTEHHVMTINSHIAFTDLSRMFFCYRYGAAGGSVRDFDILLIFEEQ